MMYLGIIIGSGLILFFVIYTSICKAEKGLNEQCDNYFQASGELKRIIEKKGDRK